MKFVMETVVKSLLMSINNHISHSAICDYESDIETLIELIYTQTKCIDKGRRGHGVLKDHWPIITSSLKFTNNILKEYTDSVESVTEDMMRNLSVAVVKLAIALVLLLSPLSVMDPLAIESGHFEYLEELVRIIIISLVSKIIDHYE